MDIILLTSRFNLSMIGSSIVIVMFSQKSLLLLLLLRVKIRMRSVMHCLELSSQLSSTKSNHISKTKTNSYLATNFTSQTLWLARSMLTISQTKTLQAAQRDSLNSLNNIQSSKPTVKNSKQKMKHIFLSVHLLVSE